VSFNEIFLAAILRLDAGIFRTKFPYPRMFACSAASKSVDRSRAVVSRADDNAPLFSHRHFAKQQARVSNALRAYLRVVKRDWFPCRIASVQRPDQGWRLQTNCKERFLKQEISRSWYASSLALPSRRHSLISPNIVCERARPTLLQS